MKRVGVVVDNDFTSDIRVQKEVEILKNKGFDVHVLCFAFDERSYPVVKGIQVTRFKIKKRFKDLLFFFFNTLPVYEVLWKRQIKKFIKANPIEILHVHDLYMAKAARAAVEASKRNLSIILDLHENFPCAIQSYNWTKGWLRSLLVRPKAWLKKEATYLRAADKWVVLSQSFKEDLRMRYPFMDEKDTIVFQNVIDFRKFEQFHIDPTITRSKLVTFLYFGVVAERRGIFDTLHVFRMAWTQGLEVKLLIIGPVDKSDEERFHQEMQDVSHPEQLEYIPWISLSDLVTYMHISDVFLCPLLKNQQHESGVANKIYQYMYGAKPIIASNCKPQQALIEAFNCGLIYDTQEAYLNCVEQLATDANLRNTLGTNGKKKLYETYDSDTYQNELLKAYITSEESTDGV